MNVPRITHRNRTAIKELRRRIETALQDARVTETERDAITAALDTADAYAALVDIQGAMDGPTSQRRLTPLLVEYLAWSQRLDALTG